MAGKGLLLLCGLVSGARAAAAATTEQVELPLGTAVVDDDDANIFHQRSVPAFTGVRSEVMRAPPAPLGNLPVSIWARLAPTARLYGTPGEVVNVELLLTNFGESGLFATSVAEAAGVDRPAAGASSSGTVHFPVEGFATALSQDQVYIHTGQTVSVVVTVRVPLSAPLGTARRIISLSIRPYLNPSGYNDVWVQRFLFVVDNRQPWDYDREPPVCLVQEQNFGANCPGPFRMTEDTCSQSRWSGRFQVQDAGSGLFSVAIVNEGSGVALAGGLQFFNRESFLIGTRNPVNFTYGATCCSYRVSILVTDGARLQSVCRSSSGNNPDDDGRGEALSGGAIAGIVLGTLALMAVGVFSLMIVIRKRRRDEQSAFNGHTGLGSPPNSG